MASVFLTFIVLLFSTTGICQANEISSPLAETARENHEHGDGKLRFYPFQPSSPQQGSGIGLGSGTAASGPSPALALAAMALNQQQDEQIQAPYLPYGPQQDAEDEEAALERKLILLKRMLRIPNKLYYPRRVESAKRQSYRQCFFNPITCF